MTNRPEGGHNGGLRQPMDPANSPSEDASSAEIQRVLQDTIRTLREELERQVRLAAQEREALLAAHEGESRQLKEAVQALRAELERRRRGAEQERSELQEAAEVEKRELRATIEALRRRLEQRGDPAGLRP